jgi:predicted RNA-binding Zn-ribbon protein involved in translation (DUF1610 family)
MSIDWDETYDDNSNTIYIASSDVYVDGFIWHIQPIMIDNSIKFSLKGSSSELLIDYMGESLYESIAEAKQACEIAEREHWRSVREEKIANTTRTLEITHDPDVGIVITIPTDYVAYTARTMEMWEDEIGEELPVDDEDVFCQEVFKELQNEEEDGSTSAHRILDEAILAAIDNGCEGVDLELFEAYKKKKEKDLLDELEDDEELESLEDHNKRRSESFKSFSDHPHKNGVACPECGAELIDTCPNMVLTSHPPQKKVACPECGYTGTRIC